MKANMKVVGILLTSLIGAFILLGLAFALILLNGNTMGGYSITLIVLASAIAFIGIIAAFMFKKGVGDVTDEDERL